MDPLAKKRKEVAILCLLTGNSRVRIERVGPRKVCELTTVWLTQPLKNSVFLRFFAVFPGRRYTRADLSSNNLPGMCARAAPSGDSAATAATWSHAARPLSISWATPSAGDREARYRRASRCHGIFHSILSPFARMNPPLAAGGRRRQKVQ